MKASNETTPHNRTIRITEIKYKAIPEITELDITVSCAGESDCFRAVVLDNCIIPAIIVAINGKKNKKARKLYDVIVGNIGQVASRVGYAEAKRCFNEYRKQSKSGRGRAAGESVQWVYSDTSEPYREYVGALQREEAREGT